MGVNGGNKSCIYNGAAPSAPPVFSAAGGDRRRAAETGRSADGAVAEGKILFAGGWPLGGHAPTATVDIFDYAGGSWSIAELSQPRMYMSAAAVGTLERPPLVA